jgi:hypothetical protein
MKNNLHLEKKKTPTMSSTSSHCLISNHVSSHTQCINQSILIATTGHRQIPPPPRHQSRPPSKVSTSPGDGLALAAGPSRRQTRTPHALELVSHVVDGPDAPSPPQRRPGTRRLHTSMPGPTSIPTSRTPPVPEPGSCVPRTSNLSSHAPPVLVPGSTY